MIELKIKKWKTGKNRKKLKKSLDKIHIFTNLTRKDIKKYVRA